MTQPQTDEPSDSFRLSAIPDDVAVLEAWLWPHGWCVELSAAQARPGHVRVRPIVTDPDDHDGGVTLRPGTVIRWTGSGIARVDPPVPPQVRPLVDMMLSATRMPC
ncbi:hypothetical protein ACWEQL_00300 [Kitasatospora sp. NPDC004240]